MILEIQNNKELVPLEHYLTKWSQSDADEIATRTGVSFDGTAFIVSLYGVDYTITHPDFSITAEAEDAIAVHYIPAQILLLRYLLEGKKIMSSGKFLTFRETPWGPVYVTPFTGRCLTRAAFTFGFKLSQFAAGMELLGGKKLPTGDVGYEVEALDGFKIQMMVWAGDDEFPPSCQILFSDNFPKSFEAEDLCVFCDILISDIKSKMLKKI
ncbi:MAG: DUF3786 domain-containing protein [Eubacteriales bacterium]